jgi:hypothetical protein
MSEQTINGNPTMMTDRVASYAHDAIDLVATRLGGAEERARDVAATSLAKLEARQVQAKQKVGSTFGKIGLFFVAKPAAAVGCAFAVGVVAGVLLRRPS